MAGRGLLDLVNAQSNSVASTAGSNALSDAAYYASQAKNNEDYNRGGLLGGIGYLGEKLGVGFVSSIEGIWDYAAGSIARLIGTFGSDKANKWAEEQIANDWFGDWYSHPEEWYNPSKGWQVAGDVAGGIGTSLPAIVTVAGLGLISGGTLAPAAASVIAGSTAGLAAAGRATKEAYEKTGQLGAKEFLYGALTGATEGLIEGVSGAIGAGTGVAVKAISNKFAKQATQTVARQGVMKTLAKGFIGEAFEEGVSEILAPVYQRMTIDPNAENASLSEVAYAAFVGGLSGMVMGGGTMAVSTAANMASGTRINERGQTAEVMGLADAISEFEAKNNTGDEALLYVKETRDKLSATLQKTGGVVETAQQRALLGDLNRANIAAVFEPTILRSAATAVQNADVIAEKLTAYGYTDANGNPITVTAEDIRKGYDPADPKSIAPALKENAILRTLAVSDAVGRLSMDAKAFESASLAGQDIASMDDINRYLESVPEKQVRAFGEKIGVADMYSVDAAEFNQKVRAFAQSGGLDTSARDAIVEAANAVPKEAARSMPKMLNLRNDGTVRYADADSDIAITKKGDEYVIYDYESGMTSHPMTRAEVNRALRQYQGKRTAVTELIKAAKAESVARETNTAEAAKNEAVAAEASTETEAAPEGLADYSKATAELDAKARAEVKGYNALSEPNKAMIRRVLRQAKRSGLSDADAALYASVSAKSGLDIHFSKDACAVVGKDGKTVYANGYYDAGNNRIVINPDAQNKGEAVLIHELDHALRTDMRGFARIYKQAVKGLTEEQRTEIADRYSQFDAADLLDEYNAHFAEYTLTDKDILRRLVEDKPTIGERILAFFTGATSDYADTPALEGAAKRYYKLYKKMFDSFSERNQGNNAYAGAAQGHTKQMSFSSIAYTFFGDEKMSADDFEKGNYKQKQGYKDYVEKSVGVMLQSHKGMTEKAARAEIESSIDGIVRVALAAKRAGYDILDRAAERNAKDSRKRLLFSSLEPNSDYFTSHDVSTICDKRKNFAQIYDDIVSREEQLGVPQGQRFFDNVDNYFYIHKVLADKGLTQPCRECYVESMRKNLAPMASAFLRLVQETDTNNTANDQLYHQEGKDKGKAKSNNTALRKYILKALDEYGMTASELNAERLTTAEGLAEIKITAPKIYEGFNSFYGQSKPKLPREATPFRFGELTALLTKNDGTINQNLVNRINKTGGFRLQSYSDFQVQNYVDVLQVLFEAGTLGLSGHAYTKVPAFLDATANTNLKRNISIFMYKDGGKWFVDRNDSFPGSLEDISAIVDADATGNTGIIAVSQNADMSAYIMADDRIGYGIPFHKSGIKMDVVRSTEVKTEDGRTVLGYQDIKDHTRQQSEVNAATEKKVKKPIDIYSFWDFDNRDGLSREELIKKNVTAYLDACEQKGYLPKFREYVIDNDAVLDDVLHYAKEIGSVAENSTVEDISFEYRAQDGSVKYRVPYGYYKFLGDFSMFAPDGSAVPIQPLSLANYDFKAAEDFFSDAETVRRNELLQQFANGEERKRYRESGMTAEQLQDVIAAKRGDVVDAIVGKKKYSLPIDKFDISEYNEIKLPEGEYNRAYSEALVWDSDKRNKLITRALSNEVIYSYVIDDNGLVRFYDRQTFDAMPKKGEMYDNQNRKRLDLAVEMLRAGQRNNNSTIDHSSNGRSAGNDHSGNLRAVPAKGKNNGAGNTNNRISKQARPAEYHFNYDKEGNLTGHGTVTYSDGRKKRFSLPKADEAYMDAVKSGDMDTAQKMVDEAANAAMPNSLLREGKAINKGEEADGTLIKMYHGSGAKGFYTFEPQDGAFGKGVYVTSNWDEAVGYAIEKLDINENDNGYYEWNGEEFDGIGSIGEALESAGYVRAFYANVTNENDISTSPVYWEDVIALVRDTSQLKSADPVTYDDNGNIIPLSERFNPKRNDIRYSLPKEDRIVRNISATRAAIVSDLDAREYKPSLIERIGDAITSAQIAFTNAQAGIEKVGRILGVNVEPQVEAVRSSGKAAEAMIGFGQYEIGKDGKGESKRLGDGIGQIYKSVRGISDTAVEDFNAYLLHWRHIDSMTLEERSQKRMDEVTSQLQEIDAAIAKKRRKIKALGKKKSNLAKKNKLREEIKELKQQRKPLAAYEDIGVLENKPVLGAYIDDEGNAITTTVDSSEISPFTVEESRELIEALDKQYPQFKEKAEAVWAYNRNLNRYRVDTGLITQEQFDEMQWRYQHYVPAIRADSNMGIGAIDGKHNLAVKQTVKRSKGSTKRIISPEVIIARQTMETVKAGRANQLMRSLSDAANANGDKTYIEVVSRKKMTAEELANLDPTTIRPKAGEITFFRDGEMQTLRVSQEVFAGFDDFNTKAYSNVVFDAIEKMNNGFKRLVTSASPAFLVRNGLRDIQDAGFNTKYGKAFAKNYGVAINQFRTNGDWLAEFIAYGGYSSSVFDFNKGASGLVTPKGWSKEDMSGYTGVKKAAKPLLKAVETVENVNQMIEMIPRLAEYISAREAGKSPTQAILAAADVTTNFGRSGKVTRVLNRTIIPFLNPSIQGFAKMYRNVKDAATAGDVSEVARAFGSIAMKAAIIGIIPMALNRLMYEDDEDYQNLREEDKENNYLFKVGDTFIRLPRGRVASAVAGLYNRSANAVQGKDVDIGGYLKNLVSQVTPVESASRTIFSPIIRDLPTNTTWYGSAIEGQQFENMAPEERYDESTSSIAIALGKMFNYSPKKIHYLIDQYSGVVGDIILPMTTQKAERDYISANFTLDPATNNKISTSFYDVYDQITYQKTAGDEEAALALKFLNKTKSAVSELYDLRNAVQKSDKKTTEKLAETRAIQLEINSLQLKALEDLNTFRAAIQGTENIANDSTYSTMIAAGVTEEKLNALKFAEATRLVYGEEQALQWYDKDVYEKASLFNAAGVSYYSYYEYYFSTRGISADVDKKGNTVEGSKRKKVVEAVNKLNISAQQKLLLLSAYGYKVQDGDVRGIGSNAQKSLLSYIMKLRGISSEERVQLLKACGFNVVNGKVVLK